MSGRSSEIPSADAELWAGEILGAPVRLEATAGLRAPIEGILVDETLSLLVVRIPGRTRAVRVPKAIARGTIVLGGRELPLKGTALRVRPEDRTKRLLASGPRRFR